jgi:4-amino-4-deoxychorismate lyase
VSGNTAIWLNGAEAVALPLPDRGLDFGDGLFETLLVRGARPLYSELHLARLQAGCRALMFPDCISAVGEQLQQAAAACAARDWHWSALRVTLTRGAGPRGYAPPENAEPRIIIAATRLPQMSHHLAVPARLGLAGVRWPAQPLLAGLKHLNRLENVLAARECRDAGYDEAVMLDQWSRPVSVVAGNLFALCDGELMTAPLESCGIAGTRRDLIMRRWAPALGLAVREEFMSVDQLEGAQEVFYSNSLLGLRPVASFGQGSWREHPLCESLHRLYRDELA